MPIKFKCEHCSIILTVKDDLAGRRGKCPKCHNVITVPSAQGASGSNGAQAPAQQQASTPAAPPRATSGVATNAKLMVQNVGPVKVVTILEPRLTEPADIRQIGESLIELLEQQEKPQIILDFSKVTYLPSAMIGKLTAMHKKAESHKGILVFCSIDPGVMQIFKITRLDKVFNIYPDMNAAMNAMKSRIKL